jgi:transcriptional regulator with PAS, ATPase and Fis domain
MQPTMQSKLLRVLEDRKVRRIGATTDLSVDVRIIAATNQDIQSLLDDNKFRNDLYYRLNSFEIVIPPLREHPEDIPVLLEYYTDLLSRKMNKKITAIDESVVRILQDYNFPGNIRELRNMVERAIILSDGNRLTSREFAISGISPDAEMVAAKEYEQIFDLEELEKLTIIRAMEQTGYKKTEAAQLLNITRQSLDRRIEKHGLKL